MTESGGGARQRQMERGESSASGRVPKIDEVKEKANFNARPVGSAVKISGNGEEVIKYYSAFEFDGSIYELEDPVLLTPEDVYGKPLVVIITEITQIPSGDVMIRGNKFYRPDEARKNGCADWFTLGSRELLYSFDSDQSTAESIMHKCIVHFLPPENRIPARTKYPGFIVRRIYDSVGQKLWVITDRCFSDENKLEINRLINKTEEHLGKLPSTDDTSKERMRNACENTVTRSSYEQTKDHSMILKEFGVCTGDTYRDRWLEKLLTGIHVGCQSDSTQMKDKENKKDANNKIDSNLTSGNLTFMLACEHIIWPDDAVGAAAALEKAVHKALCSDFRKYNQKMRQFHFNIQHSIRLAKRLLKKELEPSMLLKMSPTELKEGLLAHEKESHKSEPSRHIKMVDAQCIECPERCASVIGITNTGESGEQYQLECTECRQTWTAPISGETACAAAERKKPFEGT